MARRETLSAANAAFYLVAACYALVMLNLLFRIGILLEPGRVVARSYNLVPFHTILGFWRVYSSTASGFALRNLLGNVVLFVPFGLYLGVWERERRGRGVVVAWAAPVAVELLQFLLDVGALDIDDVILNGIGGCIGLLGYRLLLAATGRRDRAKMGVTALSVLVGVPIICIQAVTAG